MPLGVLIARALIAMLLGDLWGLIGMLLGIAMLLGDLWELITGALLAMLLGGPLRDLRVLSFAVRR